MPQGPAFIIPTLGLIDIVLKLADSSSVSGLCLRIENRPGILVSSLLALSTIQGYKIQGVELTTRVMQELCQVTSPSRVLVVP